MKDECAADGQPRAGPALDRRPRKIAVFRALMLGDMLCATPALRALRAAWPEAEITLIGLPWAAGLAQRLASVDDFEAFPGWPGMPELQPASDDEVPAFMRRMRSRGFDLAIQLHGSGQTSNALVAGFGAACNAGFAGAGAWIPPEEENCFADWPEQGSEIVRLLALTDRLGLPRRGLALELPVLAQDHARAAQLVPMAHRYAVVHAGAQLASRRWPARNFAAVADRLAQAGLGVVLTGTALERELVASVAAAMRQPALNLCGRTDLWTLGALLASASVLVCNDTGLSHMAAALGTPSVVVACGSEVGRWAPLDAARHRVLWHDTVCRPCAHRSCPIGHPCAQGLVAGPVAEAAIEIAHGGNA